MSSIDRQRVPARRSSRADVAIETRHIPVHNAMTIQRNKGPFLMVGLPTHAANCITTMPAPVDQKKWPRKAPRAPTEPVQFVECSSPARKPHWGLPWSRPPNRYVACFTRRNTIVPAANKSNTSSAKPQVETAGMASITVTVPRISLKT